MTHNICTALFGLGLLGLSDEGDPPPLRRGPYPAVSHPLVWGGCRGDVMAETCGDGGSVCYPEYGVRKQGGAIREDAR